MKTVVHVVGARPNYMKIAPLMEAMKNVAGVRQLLVNTGQHYDDAMSKAFLRELGLPKPDRDLEVGSASHAVQIATPAIISGKRVPLWTLLPTQKLTSVKPARSERYQGSQLA